MADTNTVVHNYIAMWNETDLTAAASWWPRR